MRNPGGTIGPNSTVKKALTLKKMTTVEPPAKKEAKKKPEDLPGIELTDPTSVTLINSFLIKNAGPTFDNYHKAMQ
jgi:uncharacterized Zn ribbon protein